MPTERNVSENDLEYQDSEEVFTLACVRTKALKKGKPLTVTLNVNGKSVNVFN